MEETRSCERIALAPKVRNLRTLEGTVRVSVGRQGSYWSIERHCPSLRVEVPHRRGQVADDNGTTRPGVRIGATLPIGRAPGQTATPIRCGIELKATNQEVQHTAGITQKKFAFTKWQLIYRADRKNMPAVEVVGTVVQPWINGEIVAVVI